MGVRTYSAVFITCDWPGCDAEETYDPPQADAQRAARAAGWTITMPDRAEHRQLRARCPLHVRRRWTRRCYDCGGPWKWTVQTAGGRLPLCDQCVPWFRDQGPDVYPIEPAEER